MTAENVLVIAVNQQEKSERRFQSSLDELISLCQTAGGEVHHVVTQNRKRIHPATYIGEGKLQEVGRMIDASEIDLVVANNELSAGQVRNLADALDVRVLDRSQLILDIFAMRAQTKEGKLQVELAQLEYLLPRLHGQGANLSRLGGGIGTRGPGETKLETDRRHIEKRIHDIKSRLQLVVKQRHQYRKRRRSNDVLQIAVVGYTNAGKSTIFNRLTRSSSLEENQLFATLDPLTRRIIFPSGLKSLITDTVGFIQDLPTALIAAFKSTLEEVTEADFLLHVVDVSDPDLMQQQETVRDLLDELDAGDIPVLTVYNKKDLLKEGFFIANQFPNVQVNALEEADLQSLLIKIEAVFKQEWDWFDVVLDSAEGDLLYQLQSSALVVKKELLEETNQFYIQGYIRKSHPFHRYAEEK